MSPLYIQLDQSVTTLFYKYTLFVTFQQFYFCRVFSLSRVTIAEEHYNGLPEHQKLLIPDFLQHLENIRYSFINNQ